MDAPPASPGVPRSSALRPSARRPARLRWLVHALLVLTVVVSLATEPVLALHIGFGLAFVALVGAHLAQRRRVSARLTRRLTRWRSLHRRGGRLALADLLLSVLSTAMLVSGVWDWLSGGPTRIRWHALTGVALAVFLLAHTLRRRSRLRHSSIA